VGNEKILVGEADLACAVVVVEDGRTLVVWAHLLRLLKAGRDAVAAGSGGALQVADALPDGVNYVRCRPGCGDGEEGRGRGDVAWQGGGDQAEVAAVGAVSGVVPGGAAAADWPWYASRQRWREGGDQQANNNRVVAHGMAAHVHGHGFKWIGRNRDERVKCMYDEAAL